MSTIRARFDGKVFVPEKPVQLPVGEVVEIQFQNGSRAAPGSAAAILGAMNSLPKVSAQDVADMEQLIDEAMPKAKFRGIFDERPNSNDRDSGKD
jgi:hypothetical protein